MKVQNKAVPLLLAIGLASLLMGCGRSEIRLGWAGLHTPGHVAYRYTTFEGQESVRVDGEAGHVLALTCDVEIDKGELSITLLDPDGEILWQADFEDDSTQAATLPLARTGRHTLSIEGRNAGGSFDITWDVHFEARRPLSLG
jgi:hypothetical protein